MPCGKFDSTNQKHYPGLRSEASGSMEFLRSFLRRLLVGKPVVASQNVGCFLWLYIFKVFSSLAHSHVSDAFSYFSSVFISLTRSHKSHISHIFLKLSCTLITHSRSYNLSCSHFVISHALLYVSLCHTFLTHPHTSHGLSYFPRALTSDHVCFLRLSRAQNQRY